MSRTSPRNRGEPLGPTRALRDFLATETAGSTLLVGATIVALAWANSPWDAGYEALWHTEIGFHIGRWGLEMDLREWVNDGLMSIFFLVVAIEIKRELLVGELQDRSRAALPVLAAVGGMVVPAALYLALNPSGPESQGWGVPMATDIAFAVGVLALVAPGVPPAVRLFLLTLAIVDDIGAIVVIAIFYSADLDAGWLAGAAATVAAVLVVRRFGKTWPAFFVAAGLVLWIAVHASGLHATLAGVAMGFLIPATPAPSPDVVPPAERLEHHLHRWSSLVIVPLFALANAGVELSPRSLRDAADSTVTIGIVVALVAGKTLGIGATSWAATRFGLAALPDGVGWRHVTGVAVLGGIGFTVSLFITGLAFVDEPGLVDEAKVGILAASVLASAAAAAVFRLGQPGGAKNSRAMPSGSRKLTPEP